MCLSSVPFDLIRSPFLLIYSCTSTLLSKDNDGGKLLTQAIMGKFGSLLIAILEPILSSFTMSLLYIMDDFPWGGPIYIYRKENIFSEL